MNNLYETFDNNSRNLTFEDFIKSVFLHMAIGLILTAFVSFLCYYSLYSGGFVLKVFIRFPYIVFVLSILELVLAISISAALHKMSYSTIRLLFYLYAILTGMTFSSIFIAYSIGDIFMAFVFAAGFFISMVVIGKTTSLDLTKFRTMFIAGLITLLILSIVSIFLRMEMLNIIISWFGLILYIGLTAYDVQKLRNIYYHYEGDDELENKLSIYGAMELYLDFINMFLYILRIFGSRRNND